MTITFFSVMTSMLWFSLCMILIYILLRQEHFILRFGIYPVLFLMLLALVRLLCTFELPFTKVILSYSFLPALCKFLNFMPFAFLSDQFTISVLDLLPVIWITGTVFSCGIVFLRHLRFRKYMESHFSAPDKRVDTILRELTASYDNSRKIMVRKSPLAGSPFIIGYLKPIIYLPDIDLTDEELYYILKHELNHYLHRDLWIKLLFELVCALYWWNPLSYFLKKDLDDLLEIKNDFLLTKRMPGSKQNEYLHTILKIASYMQSQKQHIHSQKPPLGLVFRTNGQRIKNRFRLILHQKETTIVQKTSALCVCLLTGTLFIGSYLFVLQPGGSPPENFENGFTIDTNAENTYLIDNKDGTYSMYVEGECWITSIDDLTPKPYSELEIRE